ncbi:MAG: putative DNA binding domain-containing protein [Acidobacteriota bacterium]|nr:putative DNA binding domain-containing protein [Acidobacteriota bacterium]
MSRLQEQIPFLFPETSRPLLPAGEIFDIANESLLRELKEGRRLERKPGTYQAKALADYFSMFANTKPDGGVIVIGQENDGSFAGCSRISQSHLNDLERAGDNNCPDARYDIKRVRVHRADGKEDFVMLIRVFYRATKLVRTNGGEAYIRSGESKKRLSKEEATELEIDKGQVDLEQEPCGLTYPQDFDMDLIRQYVNNYKANRKLEDTHTAEEILRQTHLGKMIANRFVPNNACALLFTKDPREKFAGCKIRFLRFDGEHERTGDKWNAVKDIWIDIGSIPRQIVEAEKVLDAQIREFSRLGTDGIFYTAPEYPKQAWYEAIVNACVHRSYNLRTMNIFVKMFDDRLVIESPGGFPPLVTPENIYDMPQPRNPHLFAALFFLDFVKCANEGTRRMRDSMIASKLPKPEFEQKEINSGLVRVTLRNDIKHRRVWVDKDASTVLGAALAQTLSPNEKKVVNFVAEYGGISVSQAHRLTGLKTWHSAKKLLLGLKEKNILEDRRNPVLDRDPGARFFLKTFE